MRGWLGGLIGGVCFTLPGLVLILGLAVVFLEERPPLLVLGAAAGAVAGFAFSRLSVSMPLSCGIIQSRTMRSGCSRATVSRAC